MNQTKRRRLIFITPIVIGVIFLVLVALYLGSGVAYAGRLMPGSRLAHQNLSGQTIILATPIIQAELAKLQAAELVLRYQSDRSIKTLADLGVELDVEATIDEFIQFGRRSNFLTNIQERLGGVMGLARPLPIYGFNSKFELTVSTWQSKYDQPAANGGVTVMRNQAIARPARPGRTLDVTALKSQVAALIEVWEAGEIDLPVVDSVPTITTQVASATANQINLALQTSLQLTAKDKQFELASADLWKWLEITELNDQLVVKLSPITLAEYAAGLAKQVDQPMQNASFKMSGGKVVAFQPDRAGLGLKTEAAIQTIQEQFLSQERIIELPIDYLAPKVTLASLNNLGINELVATGISNFAGSPANRRHNIKTGASKFNNALVPPGSKFSFNQVLGQVDATTGYLPELVIKGDETIPEFGGGLCQVSTTAFRAILNGGYPVDERKNHSYRVVYYEPAGTDATIYPPSPDLKFTNDSPGHILMRTYIVGNNLYFEFYGTKLPRTVKLEGPRIYNVTAIPEPVYIDTSTLPEGEMKQVDTAHRGADAVLTRVILDGDGKEISREDFKSHYVPWPAKYLVGVKAAPPVDTNLNNVPPDSSGSEQPPVDIIPPQS